MKIPPTHYLARIGAEYTFKNNLSKAIHAYYEELDGHLIPIDQLSKFMRQVKSKIDELNEANKRCKPINIYFETDFQPNRPSGRTYIARGFYDTVLYLHAAIL